MLTKLAMDGNSIFDSVREFRLSRASADPVLLSLLACSLAGNVWLGVELIRRPASSAAPAQLTVGETVPPFEAQHLNGKATRVEFGLENANTVLYVFTPSCQWCARNLTNVKAVAAAAGSTFRFVAVSLDPNVGDYVQSNQIRFPVLVRPSAATSDTYHLGTVPYTVIVSPAGRVLRVWRGAYTNRVAPEVEQALGISLPGLTD
jgi:peroxiredoxin